jgi:hypothetical protein
MEMKNVLMLEEFYLKIFIKAVKCMILFLKMRHIHQWKLFDIQFGHVGEFEYIGYFLTNF